jgi:hypothetical protein
LAAKFKEAELAESRFRAQVPTAAAFAIPKLARGLEKDRLTDIFLSFGNPRGLWFKSPTQTTFR